MSALLYFGLVAGLLLLYFLVFFAIAQAKQNNAIVDIGWGLGFVVVAVFSLLYKGLADATAVGIAVTALVALWGLRLFLYIGIRNFGKPEDFRYRAMRAKWGTAHPARKAWFRVFLPQAGFMAVVAAPIYAAFFDDGAAAFGASLPGIVLFFVGFFFEAVGDAQLRAFVKRPENKGKVMTSGLWRYTRHPNYFGEVLMWWSLFLVVVPTPWGLPAVVSALTISFLILFVSGVPLLEKKYRDNPAFQEYARKTNVFFPWIPRK